MKTPVSRPSDWSVLEMLRWATGYFKSKGVPSPRLSIEWLLAHTLQVRRLDLYLQFDRPLTTKDLHAVRPLILRRASHEPLQYITGSTDFHQLSLLVNRHVLIPRPETEQLVDLVLQRHAGEKQVRVLDIGTGSGCIALALKKARPDWDITALEICPEALKVARLNAENNQLKLDYVLADMNEYRNDHLFDLIISNPPYVTPAEFQDLEPQVKSFEPQMALMAHDISNIYHSLIHCCERLLSANGFFYFEINESHHLKLLNICNLSPFKAILLKDYTGANRFITGKLNIENRDEDCSI